MMIVYNIFKKIIQIVIYILVKNIIKKLLQGKQILNLPISEGIRLPQKHQF